MKIQLQFPHNNRIITARSVQVLKSFIEIFSLLTLVLITLLNFHTQLFPPNEVYTKLKLESLINPVNYSPYIELGVYFNDHGLSNEAKHYFLLAESLYAKNRNQELGIQASPLHKYSQLMKEKQTLINEIRFWEKVAEEKPGYRDAYLQLGMIYYKLGDLMKMKKAVDQAISIDSLFPYKTYFPALFASNPTVF